MNTFLNDVDLGSNNRGGVPNMNKRPSASSLSSKNKTTNFSQGLRQGLGSSHGTVS